MNTSNWSGRTARTTTEAFGPYAKLCVPNETPKTPLSYKVLYVLAMLVAVWMSLKADGILP